MGRTTAALVGVTGTLLLLPAPSSGLDATPPGYGAPPLTAAQLTELGQVRAWRITYRTTWTRVGSWSGDLKLAAGGQTSATTLTESGTVEASFVVSNASGGPDYSPDPSTPASVSVASSSLITERYAISNCTYVDGNWTPGTLSLTQEQSVKANLAPVGVGGAGVFDGSAFRVGVFRLPAWVEHRAELGANPPRALMFLTVDGPPGSGTQTNTVGGCGSSSTSSPLTGSADISLYYRPEATPYDPGIGTAVLSGFTGDTQVRVENGRFVIRGSVASEVSELRCVVYRYPYCSASTPEYFGTVTTTASGSWEAVSLPAVPVTTATPTPLPNANGWNKSDVTVALAAATGEGGSAVQSLTYSAAGAQPLAQQTVTGASASLTLSDEGVTTITFFATDVAGRAEDPKTFVVSIDKTPPTVTPQPLEPEANEAGWNKENVTLTFKGFDSLSGIDGEEELPVVLFQEGTKLVNGAFTDRAGNTGSASALVRIDSSAPTVDCAAPDGGWHADNVQLACSATDGLSGLASDNDASFSLATSVAPGEKTADAATNSKTVCDKAGNCADAGPIRGNRIDRSGPAVTLTDPAVTLTTPAVLSATASAQVAGGGAGTLAVGPVGGSVPAATVTWGGGAFGGAGVTVSAAVLDGSSAGPAGPVLAAGTVLLELRVTAADGSPVSSFQEPLDLAFPNAPATFVAGYWTSDGAVTRIPELSGTSLPAGQQDGWYRDGTTVHVLTRHATSFGLLTGLELHASAPARVRADARRIVVSLAPELPTTVRLVLTDRRGKVLATRTAALPAGATKRSLPLPKAARRGLYLIRLTGSGVVGSTILLVRVG